MRRSITAAISILICASSCTPSPDGIIFRTDDAVYPGAWSKDGNSFFATLNSGDRWRVIEIDVSSGDKRDVPTGLNGAGVSDVREDLLLLESNDSGDYDIYIFNLLNQSLQRVTRQGSDEWHPSFSNDGRTLIFDSATDAGIDIYSHDLDTGESKRLTTRAASEQAGRLSPDGKALAFHRQTGEGNYDIFQLNLSANTEAQITTSEADDSYPQWTPDGTQIIFSSNRTGNFDLFVVCVSSGKIVNLTNSGADERYPKLSHDGGRIAYQIAEETGTRIEAIPMTDTLRCD